MDFNDPSQALAYLESKQSEARWRSLGALKEAVETPSSAGWTKLVAILAKFPKAAEPALITWLKGALEGWPVDLRRMPPAWRPRGKKASAFAELARLTLLSSADSWVDDDFTREGTVRAWGAAGKDVFVRATGLEPNRAGGELELLDGDGKVTFTIVNDSAEYGEGRAALFGRDARRVFTAYDTSDGLLVVATDTTTGERAWETPLAMGELDDEECVVWLASNPKEQWLAVLRGDSHKAFVLRTKSGKVHREFEFEGTATAVAVSSSTLFVATDEGITGYPLAGCDGAKACGEKRGNEKQHGTVPLENVGKVVRLLTLEGSILEAVTSRGHFRWQVEGIVPTLPPESLETWEFPANARPDEVAFHPVVGVVFSDWSSGSLKLVSARTGKAFNFDGECIWASPLPDGWEWLVVERVPDPVAGSDDDESDEVDETKGGVYLFSPDGAFQGRANKVRARPHPLEAACSRHEGLSSVVEQESLEVLRYALERHKWDVNGEDRGDFVGFKHPLHNAAQLVSKADRADNPAFAKLKLLLEHGADAAQLDDDRGTNALHALFHEISWNRRTVGCPEALEEIALLLLRAGCNPWGELGSGVHLEEGPSTAPARYLSRCGFVRCIGELTELRGGLVVQAVLHRQWRVVDLLLERGVSLSSIDEATSMTALHQAVWKPDVDLIRELLRRGIDTEVAMGDGPYAGVGMRASPGTYAGFTALHLTAYRGDVDAVTALLDGGANIEARTAQGWTPAHLAAEWGHIPVLQILFRRGADPNTRTKAGEGLHDLSAASRGAQAPRSDPSRDAHRDRTAKWLASYLACIASGGTEDARETLLSAVDRADWEQFLLDYDAGKRVFDERDLRSGRLAKRTFAGVTLGHARVGDLDASHSVWEDSSLRFVGPCRVCHAVFRRCQFPDMGGFEGNLMGAEFEDCEFVDWHWPIEIDWKSIHRCRFRSFVASDWPAFGRTLENCRFEGFRFSCALSTATFKSCGFVSGSFTEARRFVRFEGCTFSDVDFSSTKFASDTVFRDCRYDAACHWPEGFDPAAHGLETMSS